MQEHAPAQVGLGRALIIGWGAYWLLGVVGAIPLSNAQELIVHRTAISIYQMGAALLMVRLCRRLLHLERPWRTQIIAAGASAYVLGYVCFALAEITTSAIPVSLRAAQVSPRGALRVAFIGAANYSLHLLAWTGFYLAMEYWYAMREREQRLLRAETLTREAELRALRSELTPHFLFNTLNGISTLVGEGKAQEARRMIARLGDFLRGTLQEAGHADIPLAHDFQRAGEYLAIEQVRLGDRLRLHVRLDEAVGDVRVPNLILQPLVENAIQHGIAPNPEGGEMWICASLAGDVVRILFENTVPASQTATLTDATHGIGLKNTAARLAARYETAFRFEAGAGKPGRWCVRLEVPFEPQGIA